jgi:hypothetical protein
MRNRLALFLFAWVLMAGSQSALAAAAPVQRTTLQKTIVAKPVAKKESAFGAGANYSMTTDQNQQTSQKTSRQQLALEANYKLTSNLSVELGTAVLWTADGTNVVKKEDNPSWDDLDIGLSYSNQILSNLKYSLGIVDSLPTGYESRTEEVRNTTTATGGLSSKFFDKKLTLSSNVSGAYIAQTYDYSITNGESNPDSLFRGNLSMSYKVLEGLSLTAAYSLWSFHMINGENNLARNQTNLTASYSYKNLNGFIKYGVGNYDKSDGYKFLYVEDYRQMVTVGVGFEI